MHQNSSSPTNSVAGLPAWKQERTAQETLDIYAGLAHRLGMQDLKQQLEDLAFATLYPRRFAEIDHMVSQRAPERDLYLLQVLEGDWGFKGIVLSDYGASKDTVGNMNNGLDFVPAEGETDFAYQPQLIQAALLSGQVSRATPPRAGAAGFLRFPRFREREADHDAAAQQFKEIAAVRLEDVSWALVQLVPFELDHLRHGGLPAWLLRPCAWPRQSGDSSRSGTRYPPWLAGSPARSHRRSSTGIQRRS